MRLDRKGNRERLLMARNAEDSYLTRLRQVARQVDAIVRGLSPDGSLGPHRAAIVSTLERYAEMLAPWAATVGRYMLADVARRNERGWREVGQDMGRALRAEIAHAPTGTVFRELMEGQVDLITSLPKEAALRINALAEGALYSGVRSEVLAKEVLRTGAVTAARARMIARTEVSTAACRLTQARAQFAGSLGYVWRSSGDGDVRPTHAEQNGKYIPWSDPPKTDKGLAPYHAGCGPNCRCYPDPVLPDL